MLRRFVPRDAVVLDVGAHSGQFAKLFAKLAPDGTVFAFEPASYARSLLPLAKWGPWGGRIEIVPAALGDAQGTLQLNTPTKSAGSMRFGLAHLGAAGNSATAGRAEAVLVTTVDRFTAERALDRLDFVKADIEGWEMRMLTGGAGTFARMRPAMLLELVDSHLARAGDSLDTAWTLLRGWGYAPYGWTGGNALAPLTVARDGDALWIPTERTALLES